MWKGILLVARLLLWRDRRRGSLPRHLRIPLLGYMVPDVRARPVARRGRPRVPPDDALRVHVRVPVHRHGLVHRRIRSQPRLCRHGSSAVHHGPDDVCRHPHPLPGAHRVLASGATVFTTLTRSHTSCRG